MQISLCLLVTLSYFLLGAAFAWPNALVSHLAADNVTFLGTHLNLSPSQLDWMGECLHDHNTIAVYCVY